MTQATVVCLVDLRELGLEEVKAMFEGARMAVEHDLRRFELHPILGFACLSG